MNRFQQIALAIASMGTIAVGPVATAAPISPNPNVIDPTNIMLMVGSTSTTGGSPSCPAGFVCGTSYISYQHDITNSGFSVGDTINSATLNIFLSDGGSAEIVQITVSLAQTLTDMNVGNAATETLVLTAPSIADLQLDGLIGVRVEVQQQGGGSASRFVFDRSELSVDFTDNTPETATTTSAAVPEPASFALLSVGLAGFGWSRRKK